MSGKISQRKIGNRCQSLKAEMNHHNLRINLNKFSSPLIFLFLLSGLRTCVYSQTAPPPLLLKEHDVALKVGENQSVLLQRTAHYSDFFGNSTTPNSTRHLVFSYLKVPENMQIYIEPLPNITLASDFNNTLINIKAKSAGSITVTSRIVPPVADYIPGDIFLRISVYKYAVLNIICEVVGWLYFVAWSISFYPQIFQNFKRKSVRGLSFEFVFLNFTGFTVYAIYNIGLFWVKSVQTEYYEEDPTGSIPVQINDVVFAVHAVFASGLTGVQCLVYDRGSQNFSYAGRSLLIGIAVFLFIFWVVAVSNAVTWLTFLNVCSYVKLTITLIKYVPQAYLNYTRKSTSGWSIGNVLLDFTGGSFSLIQMFLIAYNFDDWFSILGDFTKFGLGMFSILFDVFFIVQHYVLYRSHREYEPLEGLPDPVINPHEDMTTSNHMQSSFDDEGNPIVPHSSSVDSLLRHNENQNQTEYTDE